MNPIAKLILCFTLLASGLYACGGQKKNEMEKGANNLILGENPIQENSTREKESLQKTSPYDSISVVQHEFRNRSEAFNLSLLFTRFTFKESTEHDPYMPDSCIVQLTVTDKASSTILDVLRVTSLMYFSSFFTDTTNIISHSTKLNADKDVVDGYFGDIIVADFNFDNRDDIAIINDMGGNGGAIYSYFIQKENRKLILDKYLTDSMAVFPSKINIPKKTLTTYVHASAYAVSKTVYWLSNSNKWIVKSRRFIDDSHPERDDE